MKPVLKISFSLALSLVSLSSFAQIVNIEDRRVAHDTTGLFWQIDFGGTLTENTNSVLSLTGAIRTDLLSEKQQWLLLGNYNLVKVGDNRAIDQGFVHLRYGYPLGGAWMWEAFGQLQRNQRLSVLMRGLAGSGLRYQLQDREKFDLAIGLLYMYEYNELEGEAMTLFRRDHRLSTYLSLHWKLSEFAELANTSYYQPLIENFGESRLSTVHSLNVRLGKKMSLATMLSLTYDGLLNQLTEGVPTTSYQWKNLLRINF